MSAVGLLLLALGVLASAAGVALLVVGLRGRAVDGLRYCRACRFCVEGIGEAGVCPECGAELAGARAVRVGRRRARRGLVAAGVVLVAIALAGGGVLGWGAARSFNWNTVKPVWMLEAESTSARPGTLAGVWGELAQRLGADELSEEAAARLARTALGLQRDRNHPWAVQVGDYIEAARGRGLVTDAEWDAYFESGMVLGASVRPVVRVGKEIPFEFTASGGRLGTSGSVRLAVSGQALRSIEGEVLAEERMQASLGLGAFGSGSISGVLRADLPVGEHELVLVVRCALSEGGAGRGRARGDPSARGSVLAEIDAEFPVEVRIAAEGSVVMVEQDPRSPPLVGALEVIELRGTGTSGGAAELYPGLRVRALRIGAAFEIFAVVNEEEVRAGRVAFAPTSGESASGMGLRLPGFRGDRLTLILRPSEAVAEGRVDLEEIYGGEMVLRDVEVEWPEGVGRP